MRREGCTGAPVVVEQSVGLGPDIGGLAGWGRSAGEKMMVPLVPRTLLHMK